MFSLEFIGNLILSFGLCNLLFPAFDLLGRR